MGSLAQASSSRPGPRRRPPLTLEVRLDTLPQDAHALNPFSLCLVFVMTDGQDLTVHLQGQRYPRVVGGRAKLKVTHRVDPSDVESDYTKYKDGRIAAGTPLRIRAAARGDATHLAFTWEGRRLVYTFAVPWRLASVRVYFSSADPGFSAQIQFPEPPPVIERQHLPATGRMPHMTSSLMPPCSRYARWSPRSSSRGSRSARAGIRHTPRPGASPRLSGRFLGGL